MKTSSLLNETESRSTSGSARTQNLRRICSCYFIVEGIEGLFKELAERAVEFRYLLRLQPYGMKEFMVIDPDGNAIRFGSIAEN